MSLATLKNTSAVLQGKTPEQYMKDKGFVSTTDTGNTGLDFYSIENGKIYHYGYKHINRGTDLAGDMGDLCEYDNVKLDTYDCPPRIILQTNYRRKEIQKNSQVQESPQTNSQTPQLPSLILYDIYLDIIHIVS